MPILVALILGVLLGVALSAGILLVWSAVGFIVAVGHYVVDKPPSTPAPNPNCQVCSDAQALWDRMSNFERGLSLLNFVAIATYCSIRGCGGLDLSFR